jgi:glycosyltransferase involved in cell wall biosynthesis
MNELSETDRPGRLPFVSVLVTRYRRREFLSLALASLAAQTLPRDQYEVVVATDSSDEDLERQVKQIGGRVVIADLPSQGEMLTRGLEACRGEVVSFLDDDDTFAVGKLVAVRDAFVRERDLTLYRNGFALMDREGQDLSSLARRFAQPRQSFEVRPPDLSRREFARIARTRAYGNLSTVSVRREALQRIAGDLGRATFAPDWAIAALLLDQRGLHRFDPRALTRRRVGPRNRPPDHGRRTIQTLSYLKERVRNPAACDYVRLELSYAKCRRFLEEDLASLAFADWVECAYYHARSFRLGGWQLEVWCLVKRVSPGWGAGAYRRWDARWSTGSLQEEPE